MNKIALLGMVAVTAWMTSGCAMYSARFSVPLKQETNIVLKEDDFVITDRNVEGTYGYPSLQVGFYPLASMEIPMGDPRLFSNAMAEMYAKTAKQVEGKPAQLVNWTLDNYSWFIPIPYFTPVVKTAKFRADVMEFTK